MLKVKQLLNKLKRKEKPVKKVVYGLDKVKKKNRKRAIELLKEYNDGIVIKIDKDINQKAYIEEIRGKN